MTFALVAIGGFLAGVLVRSAIYSEHYTQQMRELLICQLTGRDPFDQGLVNQDLADLDHHTSDGRHG